MTVEARTRIGALAAAAVLLVLGVVVVVGGHGGDARAAAAAEPSRHSSPSVRGTVTAVDGDRWSVRTAEGADVLVTLDDGTRFGSRRTPATREQFVVGSPVAVVGELAAGTVGAERVLVPMQGAATGAALPPTTGGVPAVVPASCRTTAAVQAAVDAATARGDTAAVAVLDATTGAAVGAGETALFNSASVVKVLLATQLLLTGQMTGETDALARAMITVSDDEAADELYELAGGDAVVDLVAAHYGVEGLGSPPLQTGQWGATGLSATGLVRLYAALQADPVVWPWLAETMGATSEIAADGTDQHFGLPAASRSWVVKQGWMVGIGPGATYQSTGVLDGRWAVALMATGSEERYGDELAATMTAMAQALLPAGTVPEGTCA